MLRTYINIIIKTRFNTRNSPDIGYGFLNGSCPSVNKLVIFFLAILYDVIGQIEQSQTFLNFHLSYSFQPNGNNAFVILVSFQAPRRQRLDCILSIFQQHQLLLKFLVRIFNHFHVYDKNNSKYEQSRTTSGNTIHTSNQEMKSI